jgi:mRNA interferase RelE/StbE
MKCDFRKSFLKDLKTHKHEQDFLTQVKDIIIGIEKAASTSEIKNLKKLKGEKTYYRIRSGRYRVGIKIDNDIVSFVRALPRKDIYRYFP